LLGTSVDALLFGQCFVLNLANRLRNETIFEPSRGFVLSENDPGHVAITDVLYLVCNAHNKRKKHNLSRSISVSRWLIYFAYLFVLD